jgi:hypothetical protein
LFCSAVCPQLLLEEELHRKHCVKTAKWKNPCPVSSVHCPTSPVVNLPP